jgi:hypothetical protein
MPADMTCASGGRVFFSSESASGLFTAGKRRGEFMAISLPNLIVSDFCQNQQGQP